jgi:DNA-binding NarL/FixJ family response regulator
MAVTAVVGRFDPLIEHGLAHVLGSDPKVHVIASGLEHAELERTVMDYAPEVAVLDETAEPFTLTRLRSLRPTTGVIVIAHNPSRTYGMNLLTSGATCLARSVSVADILSAVHFTAQGGRLFVTLDGERAERQYPSDVCLLTPRETEVLEHLSVGRSNPEIARTLQISVETVHTHVAHIRQKLKVQSKRDLIGIPVLGGTQVRLAGL